MTDEEFVEECFRKLLLRAPEAEGKAYYVDRLREGASRVDVVQGIVVSDEFLELLHRQAFGSHVGSRALAFAPPGHFYSPIPSRVDIARYAAAAFAQGPEALAGIDLDVPGQLALLRELGPLAADLEFADDAGGNTRYFWENGGFAPGDAVVLAAMLRYLQPARVVEIGAGLSTAVMLDVCERHLARPPSIACIEPEPERLRSLLRGDEGAHLTVHETIAQDLPLSFYTSLGRGDVLFIDSSHVLKLGSDVSFLLQDVLPRLGPGVMVHIHDITCSFAYPEEWYEEGRAWNETQAVRAFLAFNSAFRIRFFSDYLIRFERDAVARHMPLALRRPRAEPEGNTAVSLWIARS